MRLQDNPYLPADHPLARQLDVLWRQLAAQVNALSEGFMAARHAARAAAPTTGTWAQGDEVANSLPTEVGPGGSMYIIVGWKCVASGTPGTWREMRVLTGN